MIVQIIRQDGSKWESNKFRDEPISSDELWKLMYVDSIIMELERERKKKKKT